MTMIGLFCLWLYFLDSAGNYWSFRVPASKKSTYCIEIVTIWHLKLPISSYFEALWPGNLEAKFKRSRKFSLVQFVCYWLFFFNADLQTIQRHWPNVFKSLHDTRTSKSWVTHLNDFPVQYEYRWGYFMLKHKDTVAWHKFTCYSWSKYYPLRKNEKSKMMRF